MNIDSYKNKVFNKDTIKVLKKLPDESIDMVYGDPDYGVGIDYAGTKYTTKWNDYLDWYVELARESMRVLKTNGNLFMLNYPKQNAYLRVRYLDGASYDVQDYVWVYNTNIGHSKRRFTTAHRSVLHATKSKHNQFHKEQVALPYKNPTDRRIRERLAKGSVGRMPYSWFEFNLVKNVSKDKTFHACQIPLELVRLLLNASTKKGDVVFVLFGGSGSELDLAQSMGRHTISCELQKRYYNMIVDRMSKNGFVEARFKLKPGLSKGACKKELANA